MTRHELEALHAKLNTEYGERLREGVYSVQSGPILQLTHSCLIMARHLIEVDKDIAKLKRGVTNVRPKKK